MRQALVTCTTLFVSHAIDWCKPGFSNELNFSLRQEALSLQSLSRCLMILLSLPPLGICTDQRHSVLKALTYCSLIEQGVRVSFSSIADDP